MQLLSAADALSPAMNRTRDFLFRPFEWGTFLKLSAVAVLTEGLFGNFNFSNHSTTTSHMDGRSVPFNIPPGTITALIAIGIVALALGVVLLYVIVRLRFAFFHCLIHRIRELTPGWRIYREQALRFFQLTIVVALGFIAVALVALAPFVSGFIKLFQESQTSHRLDLGGAIPLVLQLIPVMLLLGLAGVALDVVLRDFMLPHMALENASAGEAWSAVLDRIGDQKGAFVLYAILRLLLPFVAMIGIFIVLAIPMVILFGIPGVMMAGIQATLGHATGAAWLAGTLLQIVLGLFMVALGLFIAIVVGGPLSIAIRNYALLFYGGRYAALGNVLAPPPAMTAPAGLPPLPA
jgi:hypothetical protein